MESLKSTKMVSRKGLSILQAIRGIILLIAVSTLFSIDTFGQCKNFAKKVCKEQLAPFVHDGNYNAAILSEGEDAELYKTFYAGQTYRILICAENLPKIHLKVMDVERNVIFDNSKVDFISHWDFKPTATQQLIVWIKVGNVKSKDPEAELVSGCVAIMFGLKEE